MTTFSLRVPVLILLLLVVWMCNGPAQGTAASPRGRIDPAQTVAAARRQIGVTLGYDPEYRVLPYPGGDVPTSTGVCTDVVTRAWREQGVDLQRTIHEDMKAHFAAYPHQWGLKAPDPNIDHRRVPNLMTYFKRQGWEVPITAEGGDYQPGDIVTWDQAFVRSNSAMIFWRCSLAASSSLGAPRE